MPRTIQTASNRLQAAQSADPYRWPSIAISVLFMCTIPLIIGLVFIAQPSASTPMTLVTNDSESGALAQAQQLAAGRAVFQNACAVCHGKEGEGVLRLGKPLHNSAFVQRIEDAAMFELIAEGRTVNDPLNTTGALMPPRGAIGLNDNQIHDVIAYLRDMQNPSEPTVSVDAWNLTGEEGGGQVAIQLDAHPGYQVYISSCAACHGEGAEGIDQLGLPLTTSGFVRGETDEGLVKFIKSGRPIWDANNTTGLDMPPKGGNPAITDEQLYQIVEYLRALQEQAFASN